MSTDANSRSAAANRAAAARRTTAGQPAARPHGPHFTPPSSRRAITSAPVASPPTSAKTASRPRWRLLAAAMALAVPLSILAVVAWTMRHSTPGGAATGGANTANGTTSSTPIRDGMAFVHGGRFRMGNDRSPSAAERPAREVVVDSFWMDQRPVTNVQFARFVEATGYITAAEESGVGWVFDPLQHEWRKARGADWRHPSGPGSSLVARDELPVVHVSWHDAAAYARWAGKRLPTEAEWEYAARGGLADADYPWGSPDVRDAEALARRSRGVANPFGLLEMSGIVWQWCADWYSDDAYQLVSADHLSGPSTGRERVARGGSPLDPVASAKVWTRGHQPPQTSWQHVGFRCARGGG